MLLTRKTMSGLKFKIKTHHIIRDVGEGYGIFLFIELNTHTHTQATQKEIHKYIASTFYI